MMDIREFEYYIRSNFSNTRVKPGKDTMEELRLLYIATAGFADEAGESIEHFKKWVREDRPLGQDLLLEMGDVLHYFTVLAWTAGFTLEQIMDANKAKLDERYNCKGNPN